jgi:transposase
MTTRTMAEQLVPDEVWAAVRPPLPPSRHIPRAAGPGSRTERCWVGSSMCCGPACPGGCSRRELGCGSGVTCWRPLRDWQAAGVWEALHHRLLDWLGDEGQVDWSRAAIDSVSVRARRGGADRRQSGRSRQARLEVPSADRQWRLPLAGWAVGRQHPRLPDAGAAVDAVPAIIGPRGPAKLHGDKGYDFPACRRLLRRRGITPRIARRGVESSQRLGRHRWRVERTWPGCWPTGG